MIYGPVKEIAGGWKGGEIFENGSKNPRGRKNSAKEWTMVTQRAAI